MNKEIRDKFKPIETFDGLEIVGFIPREQNLIEIHMKTKSFDNEEFNSMHTCPFCGGNKMTKYKTRVRALRAHPLHGFNILLKIKVFDYDCKECNKISTMPIIENGIGRIPDLSKYTFALIGYIKELNLKKNVSCSLIAKELSLSTEAICDIIVNKGGALEESLTFANLDSNKDNNTEKDIGLSFEGLMRSRMLENAKS